ncbi:hypothetical protein SAMD00019534_077530 [Acytostelium subglobosum LB1]|uniref:hypothetical protein n=1 Tax=Acytostelium subglobosum LB1 TaxID=1410327 RepID=UPI0006449694|nr:hypothetical protein SAMD00019534_077530 [Acytostelium subglobosum LB1]GAM24578.1 hypothetical protein SAMD00019534_077530 [Acytostelium subglobosum LB1]|eukprot:XP_012752247.1 hypothetical protein SAMD00019534_077530 [Acytostelium subglobosum LB1]
MYRHTIGKHRNVKLKELKKNTISLEDLKFDRLNVISFHASSDEHRSGFFSKLKGKLAPKKDAAQAHPSGVGAAASSSAPASATYVADPSQQLAKHRGVCGLTNLGNTCFMNSALQCLSHTMPFTEFFLSGRYVSDINKVNPLGMKGQIAEIYGKLMRDMWSGSSCIAPKNLKWIIGRYAPQFSGYSQQDSHELISFLLDGLHEDMNRVLKKPYIEEKEDPKEPREDSIVASEYWDNHLRRNQSVVVDLFQGQYKSTLVCSKCSKVSITFDPFMFVTLPIPISNDRLFEILLYRCKPVGPIGPDAQGVYSLNNAMAPIRYCIKLNRRDYVQTLRIELSMLTGIPSTCIALAEIFNNRIYTFLSDQKLLSFIKERETLIAYELPPGSGEEVSRLHIVHRRHKDLMLIPFVILCKFSQVTCKDIYRMVWERVGHRVKKGWRSAVHRSSKESLVSAHSSTTTAAPTSTSATTTTTAANKQTNGGHQDNKDSPVSTPENFSNPDVSQLATDDDNSSITDDESENEYMYPFVLKTANGYGNVCDRCTNGCTGCVITCDGAPLKEVFTKPKFWSEGCNNIIIDWRPEALPFFEDSESLDNHHLVKQDQTVALKTQRRGEINLNDCLSLFTKNEKLGPNDTWFCPGCKQHNEGTKKLEIWKTPRFLIIHLKRFQYNQRHEKINAYIDFPLDNLDLSRWVLNKAGIPPIYQLYAVSNHMGGMGGGHYTASVKYRDRWFMVSDSSYYSISESSVRSPEAYVLFYELKQGQEAANVPIPIPTTTTSSSTSS